MERRDMTEDKIKHPKHYTQGIECWDYIMSHDMNYLEGNIIKYVTRWRAKNGIEDLEKAKAYLEELIESETHKVKSETCSSLSLFKGLCESDAGTCCQCLNGKCVGGGCRARN
jgi:viroplasmin and RNaseH domain-containing protein